MKRAWILGLAAMLLPAVSLAQEPLPAPLTVTPPDGTVISSVPATPLSAWTGGNGPRLNRIWGNAEFLLWWTKNAPVNTPLITQATNPLNDPTSGQLNSANTRVLIGDRSYDSGMRYGGRFTFGGWLDSDGRIGVEANYLFIAPKTATSQAGSNGQANSPTLAFPYFNAITHKEDQVQFAVPSVFSGTSSLRISNELQGAEANVLVNFARRENWQLSGLVGFRYIYFREDLDFAQGNVGIAEGPAAGQVFNAADSFHASNNFYGGQFGLTGQYGLGRFFIGGTAKVALGTTNQAMDINGVTNAVFADGTRLTNATGGTFAQSTNIGRHTHNAFCVVPETDLKLGYNFTSWLQGYVGYNFLYLSDVARPGAGIDRTINPSQAPFLGGSSTMLTGPHEPAFTFSRSDFWAQGITFGLQVKF